MSLMKMGIEEGFGKLASLINIWELSWCIFIYFYFFLGGVNILPFPCERG